MKLPLTAATALAAVLVATPADATRPIVPTPADDRCWNLAGTQPIWQIGQYAHPMMKRYRFKVRTPAPGDCRVLRNSRRSR